MSLSNFVKRIRNIMRNDAGINGDAQRIEQMAWMLFLKVYDEKENDWEMADDYKVGSINSIFYFLHKTAEPFNCLEQDNLA